MWPYWIMLLIPSWAVLHQRRLPPSQARIVWVLVGLLFTFMIGLRHEVGGDWLNYIPQFELAREGTFAEALRHSDPGYEILNWLVGRLGGDIHAVNLVCAAFSMWGAMVFSQRQPNPWLALVTAVPYMLIVVAMGYTRQGVALGFVMLGLAALGDGRTRKFILLVAIGATFHKSAVLLLPIAALAASRNRLFTIALVGMSTALIYYLLLADDTSTLWRNYVEADVQSQGGAIRVAMNTVPAILLLMFRKRLVPDPHERKLWLWMAAFALVCVPLIGMASTAVDRVALYFIPLQLFVFSRLPRLAKTVPVRTPIVLGVVGYYALVQFVWLNYAVNSFAWLPYQFMPLW